MNSGEFDICQLRQASFKLRPNKSIIMILMGRIILLFGVDGFYYIVNKVPIIIYYSFKCNLNLNV